jgi:uncharacterized RDD family membrane protein YckC
MTLPETGPGAVAGFGARLLAFVVDAALSVAIAFISGHGPSVTVNGQSRPSIAYNVIVAASFLAIEFLFITLAGQTPGMRVAGVAVVRARDGGRPAIGWVLLRTLLVATIVPALIPDASGRPLHDRACGTTTIRTR